MSSLYGECGRIDFNPLDGAKVLPPVELISAIACHDLICPVKASRHEKEVADWSAKPVRDAHSGLRVGNRMIVLTIGAAVCGNHGSSCRIYRSTTRRTLNSKNTN
ncbi:MAG: hypothetical protein HC889_18975 [Synechococcaceae cyanobacterium SM1_2_3]|nr:hypothetical protein [Synechococcaceae cyanobacterium SM1_2_3]